MPRNYQYCYLQELQLLFCRENRCHSDEVLDTTDRIESIKDDLDIVRNSLQIIDQQRALIKVTKI